MIITETPMCIILIKIVTHIFAAETFTCINAAETSNCIIATETVTFHSQKWCQLETLLVIIKKFSE